MNESRRMFWRAVFLITLALGVPAILDVLQLATVMHIDLAHSKWLLPIGSIGLVTLSALVLLILSWTRHAGAVDAALDRPAALPGRVRIAGAVLFTLLCAAYSWLIMLSPVRWFLITNPPSGYFVSGWDGLSFRLTESATGMIKSGSVGGFPNPYLHLWSFWILCILGVQALRLGRKELTVGAAFVFTLLVQTAAYRAASFLSEISVSPFTLSYSEASRYYYASLPFALRIYGVALPWSFLHPTRYILQALPFALPGLTIEYHRAWQVLLWLATSAAAALLLTRRLRISDPWTRGSFAIWTALFMLLVSVYYHLLICVIIVLAGFSIERPWRTLGSVLLASAWAGMSRVNWFPVPAMLACTLYFLEVPLGRSRNVPAYFAQPALWFAAGTATAFVFQAIYIPLSGNTDISRFGSSFTADLLWYRLWPNPTFWLGIVPGTLLFALPLLLGPVYELRANPHGWNTWRGMALAACALVLFAGGLIVSVKIGGGTLHNMDAFMVTLLIIGAYICFGRFTPETGAPATPRRLHWTIVALAALIPFSFFITDSGTLEPYNRQVLDQVLKAVRSQVRAAARQGDVLFIQQRQLLTFGYIKDVPLVPDYEVVTLMEMAMAHNTEYMGRFYDDLAHRRFAMIVAPPQFTLLKGSDYTFGEENDVWVTAISIPILCEYAPMLTIPRFNIQLLVPRAHPGACPSPK